MSVFSQNRVYAFTEEGIQANQQQPTEVDTKAPAQGITPNQSTDSSGEEVTLNKEIDDQGKEVTESLDVEYDPEMYCEMFDQYIDEEYQDDMELSLYVAEMQTKMDQTLDAIFENFTFISEADDEGEQKESEDGGSQEQQTQNAGPKPDNQAKLGGHVAGKAELAGIKIKDLIQKILAKIKEVIGKIGAKIKEFATKFAEDLKAFYAIDATTYLIYSKALDKVNPDKFNAEFPGVQVNKYLFESIIKEKALGLVGGYDFKSFLQPLYDGKIDVKNMKKPQVEEANKKFNDELKDAINKFDETIKGYNEKPELVKCTLGEVQVITLAYGDSIISNDSKFVGVEKNYKKMADSSMQILDNMSKAAQEMLDKVTTENQDEDSDIVFAARSLYKNTTDCTMACGKAIVQIGKYNLKKLNTCRRVYISAGKWCKGEGKKKPEAVAASADMSIGSNSQVLTETPLAAGIVTMSAFYLAYFTGVFKLASKMGLDKINKALHVYEKNNKGNADFVKFSDLDKETVKKSGDQDEKKETISSKIANVFGKGTDNDTIDIYKDKSGNEVFSVSYKKKLGGDSRDKIQFTMMDDKRKDFAAYYIACVTTKKFGYTSTKIDNWANNILTTDTSGVVTNEAFERPNDKKDDYEKFEYDKFEPEKYGEVTVKELNEEYDLIMKHLQVMQELDQYIGIDESVILENQFIDKIKEIAKKMIEKVKEFFEKFKVFILQKYKDIKDNEYWKDDNFKYLNSLNLQDWKDFEVRCDKNIFENYIGNGYNSFENGMFKYLDKLREKYNILIIHNDEDIQKEFEETKAEIDKMHKELMDKLENKDIQVIKFDNQGNLDMLAKALSVVRLSNNVIKDNDKNFNEYKKMVEDDIKDYEQYMNKKDKNERIAKYGQMKAQLASYTLSKTTEFFLAVEKKKFQIVAEEFKIYFAALRYAKELAKKDKKEDKAESKTSEQDKADKDDVISNEFKKAVEEGKVLRVRLMLKNSTMIYQGDWEPVKKQLVYAEDNLPDSDELFDSNAEDFDDKYSDKLNNMGSKTAKEIENLYNELATKIVNNFSQKNLHLLSDIAAMYLAAEEEEKGS